MKKRPYRNGFSRSDTGVLGFENMLYFVSVCFLSEEIAVLRNAFLGVSVVIKQSPDSKIVMVDLKDDNGKLVTIVMVLKPTSKKGNALDIIKISSAEGRSHIQSLFKYGDGKDVTIRYVEKKNPKLAEC